MPDKRIHKLVAERCELQFNRRPHPLLRWRRWVGWSCFCLAILFLGFKAWRKDQNIYQARPVSLVHQQYQDDCSQCHRVRFQTLRLLLNDDKFVHKVEDSTCGRCHDQAADDHHANVLTGRAFDCFSCHREHSGKYGLARVESSFCVTCHHDLHTDEGPSKRFVRAIDSFANHAEFAINRKQGDLNFAVDQSHLLRLVAEPSPDGRGWIDKSTIHFPHDKHLDPAGIMVPASHPLAAREPARAEEKRRPLKVLNCDSCHITADDGRYMKPIIYEQHCAECHPLAISTRLGLMPHEDPELIQGVLRDRLMNYARQHPQVLSQDKGINESRLPNERSRTPSTRDVWDWSEEQLTKRPGNEHNSLAKRIELACAYCHTITAIENESRLLPFEIEPTRIPHRWWGHASFRHDRHDVSIMDCTDCHAARASSSANDILLPRIENCQECHAPSSEGKQSGAAHDCVECHTYHEDDAHGSVADLIRESKLRVTRRADHAFLQSRRGLALREMESD